MTCQSKVGTVICVERLHCVAGHSLASLEHVGMIESCIHTTGRTEPVDLIIE